MEDVSCVPPVRLVEMLPCTRNGQVGEIIGKIVRGDPSRDFPGYTRGEATEKKARQYGLLVLIV